MKKICLSFFTLLALFTLPFINTASAFYGDSETSINNNVSAGSLDFSLKDDGGHTIDYPLFNDAGVSPPYTNNKTIVVTNEGSLKFKYHIAINQTSGDISLCQALTLDAQLDGTTTKYTGSLLGMTITPDTTLFYDTDPWNFRIGLTNNDPALENTSCQFTMTFSGYQENSDGSWGFTDKEQVYGTIATGTWNASLPFVGLSLGGFAPDMFLMSNPDSIETGDLQPQGPALEATATPTPTPTSDVIPTKKPLEEVIPSPEVTASPEPSPTVESTPILNPDSIGGEQPPPENTETPLSYLFNLIQMLIRIT